MIGGLLPLIVLGVIVYAIVAAVRRHREAAPDRGGGGGGGSEVRRLFVHVMLFASMLVTAFGVMGTLGLAISDSAARRGSDLAAPLAMTVVGLPVFVALAAWVRRTHRADASERTTMAWGLYLNAALLTTLGAAIGTAFAVANSVVDRDWDGTAVAGFVVWTALWIGHWMTWRAIPPTTLARTHLWLASGAGLWILGGFGGVLLGDAVQRAFHTASDAVVTQSTRDLWMAVAGILIGAAVWAWHWLAHGLRAPRSEGWYVYVLLFGVLAGLVAAVWGAGYGLYLVLEWFIGESGGVSATVHFADMAAPIAAGAVGLAVWRYHRAVVGPSATRERTEIDRIYDYLVSGVALATVAVAVVILVLAFFEAIGPAAAGGDGEGTGVNTLLAAVTLLLVGGPMWAIAWQRVQHLAADNEEEAVSSTRRTYLFGIFGIGGAVAFGALIALLVAVFQALLGEDNGDSITRAIRWPVALLVTTGGGALYHWLVYRAERHLVVRFPHRDVLLVGDGVLDIDEIAKRVHAKVRVLHRLDLPEGGAPSTDAIVDAIAHAEGEHLLVIAEQDEVRVLPYE